MVAVSAIRLNGTDVMIPGRQGQISQVVRTMCRLPYISLVSAGSLGAMKNGLVISSERDWTPQHKGRQSSLPPTGR